MRYRQFIFESYKFDPVSGELELNYSLDGQLSFKERFKFDFPFVSYDQATLDRALRLLFLIAGISYYKTYIPPEIVLRGGDIDKSTADFLSKTYSNGLGEFWYVNQLDPDTPVVFPANQQEILNTLSNNGEGILVGIGGGKDSLVSIELLRARNADITTWSLNHRPQLTPLVERIGLPHLWVERQWDSQLKELADQGAFNGHVPISAILASVGTVVAVLADKRDVVTSNEQSASEPTLTYRGKAINHQYSKSLEFEQDFQVLLRHHFGENPRYYSFLRPITEVRIAELFSRDIFNKYKDVFSSCNRAYIHTSNRMSWCGECPKCAFTFLAFTPFIPREQLEVLFGDKNLLLDSRLELTYRNLLGTEGDKPMECVGEIKESRAAMRLAQQQYPELNKYEFDLPDNYDFRVLGPHIMPPEIYEIFMNGLKA